MWEGAFLKVIHVTHNYREMALDRVKPCVMAMGFFDGIHLGHQRVIYEARKIATEKQLPFAIMSFFPHPKEVLFNGEKVVPYLMPPSQKQKIFEKMGVDIFYHVHFDREFAALSPKQFVYEYLLEFGAKVVVAGFDFTYGDSGEGNMNRIEADSDGKLKSIKVRKLALAGQKISSTLIRELILAGEVEKIPDYLGASYQLEGKVIFDKDGMEVKVDPYYLFPVSGKYEVTVQHRNGLRQMIAFVDKGRLTLLYSNELSSILFENEPIRIEWNKRSENQLEIIRKPVYTN